MCVMKMVILIISLSQNEVVLMKKCRKKQKNQGFRKSNFEISEMLK